ncbi:MAG: Kazal-type serine protease inhibitor [Polyangiales bacterium]
MSPTFTRRLSLLAALALAACSLEATGMGPEDASASVDPEEDAGTTPPTGKPVERDAAVADARVPTPVVDAGQPDADAPRDAAVDAAVDASAPVDAGPTITRCGTRGGVRCGADAFCNFEPDPECGALDRGGLCEARPDRCATNYSPVCGCDGITYPNACTAHAQGMSVRRASKCGADECQAAGGRVRTQANGGCQRARAMWEITVNGQSAFCCVGGANPDPGPVTRMCGGIAGLACGAGQFCNYEVAAGGLGCGVADASGVCETRPDACTQQDSPVCGCDRRTYGNACTAHASGVAVLREGACERGTGRP